MKIPQDIKSRNKKIRDAYILKLYLKEHLTHDEIAAKVKLTRQRVQQIVYKNSHLLIADLNYHKTMRINALVRQYKRYQDSPLTKNKDMLDITKELRAELEGTKVEVNGNMNHSVVHMDKIEVNGEPLEFDIGTSRLPQIS